MLNKIRLVLAIIAFIAVAAALRPGMFENALSALGISDMGANAAVSPKAPPKTVTVASVEKSAYRERLIATGGVRSWDAVDISPQTAGRVEQVLFEDGHEVEEGHVLVRLDDRMERAALVRAEALVVEATAALQRAETLRARGAGTAAALDTARAELAVVEAERDQAAVALSRMTIRAPFSGVLSSRRVSPGAYIQPGTPLTRLDSLGRVKADLLVPSRALAVLDRGQQIYATTVAHPGKQFEGAILDLDTRLDPETRQVIVRAAFPDPARTLFPGLELVAEIVLGDREAILLPETSLVSVGPSAFVFVVNEENIVERRAVMVGARRNAFVVIEEGLEEGSYVVVEGAEKLADGDLITAASVEESVIRDLLTGLPQ